MNVNRRNFLKSGSLALGAAALPEFHAAHGNEWLAPRADACLLIWLPGGVAQTETFDPKQYTPFERGMDARRLKSTFRSIPTSADGVRISAGLPLLARQMHHGTICNGVTGDSVSEHQQAQQHTLSGIRAAVADVPPPSLSPTNDADYHLYNTGPFGLDCLRARRLIESGARYVEAGYPYSPFGGFDTHEHGHSRMARLLTEIDRPVSRLIGDLHSRGLLRRTLVVILTEFGRTADLSHPTIETEAQYGLHAHLPQCRSVVFFGGGISGGRVLGRTADEHPFVPLEKAVSIADVHAVVAGIVGRPASRSTAF